MYKTSHLLFQGYSTRGHNVYLVQYFIESFASGSASNSRVIGVWANPVIHKITAIEINDIRILMFGTSWRYIKSNKFNAMIKRSVKMITSTLSNLRITARASSVILF